MKIIPISFSTPTKVGSLMHFTYSYVVWFNCFYLLCLSFDLWIVWSIGLMTSWASKLYVRWPKNIMGNAPKFTLKSGYILALSLCSKFDFKLDAFALNFLSHSCLLSNSLPNNISCLSFMPMIHLFCPYLDLLMFISLKFLICWFFTISSTLVENDFTLTFFSSLELAISSK